MTIDPKRMSIDALISFARAENPNAQTDALLDAGDIILELATDDQGNRYLRTAFKKDANCVASLCGWSSCNLRNIISFIVNEKLWNYVAESQKEQIRTAFNTLNNKIRSYNALALRPILPFLELSELPTDSLVPTELVRIQINVAEKVQNTSAVLTQTSSEAGAGAIDFYEAAQMSRQVADIARHFIYEPRQHKICQKGDGNLVFQAFAEFVFTVGEIKVRVPAAAVCTPQELRTFVVEYFKLNFKGDTHLRRLLLSAIYELNVSLDVALNGYTRGSLLKIDQAFATFDSYIALGAPEEYFVNARKKQREFRTLLATFANKSELELAQSLTEIRNGLVPAFEELLNQLFAVKLDHKDKTAKHWLKEMEEQIKKLKDDAEITLEARLEKLLDIFQTVKESIKTPFEQVIDENKANMKRLGIFCGACSNLLSLISQMQKDREGILDITVGQKIDISVINPDRVFADYFKLVEKDGFWSALPEIYALSRIFNFNVEIATKQGGQRVEAPALSEYLPVVEGALSVVKLDFVDKSKFTLFKEPFTIAMEKKKKRHNL
jgi:hypothetical protein